MAVNALKCNHLTPLGLKGLRERYQILPSLVHLWTMINWLGLKI